MPEHPRGFYVRYIESLHRPASPAPDLFSDQYWRNRAKWHALQNELRDHTGLNEAETLRDEGEISNGGN